MRIFLTNVIRQYGVFILLSIFVLWGGYLRFHNLTAASFWIDEAFSVSVSQGILENAYPLIDNNLVIWRAFPTHYIMSLGLLIFNDIHLGARFFSAFFGTVLIIIFYFFNLEIFKSKKQALISCLMRQSAICTPRGGGLNGALGTSMTTQLWPASPKTRQTGGEVISVSRS